MEGLQAHIPAVSYTTAPLHAPQPHMSTPLSPHPYQHVLLSFDRDSGHLTAAVSHRGFDLRFCNETCCPASSRVHVDSLDL